MENESNKKHVLLLLSGGIDSTACIHYYKTLGFEVECLFVIYGQKAKQKEIIAVKNISKYYNVKVRTVSIETELVVENGIILGRNILLLSVALMNFSKPKGIIAMGVHTGTKFPDCSKEFIEKTQMVFNSYKAGSIIVDCPFISMTKLEIFEYCKINKIPLKYTYSCEYGKQQPCGECSTCIDLMKLYDN